MTAHPKVGDEVLVKRVVSFHQGLATISQVFGYQDEAKELVLQTDSELVLQKHLSVNF